MGTLRLPKSSQRLTQALKLVTLRPETVYAVTVKPKQRQHHSRVNLAFARRLDCDWRRWVKASDRRCRWTHKPRLCGEPYDGTPSVLRSHSEAVTARPARLGESPQLRRCSSIRTPLRRQCQLPCSCVFLPCKFSWVLAANASCLIGSRLCSVLGLTWRR